MQRDNNVTKQIGEVTKRGFLVSIGLMVRECHWAWLVAGVLAGWPIDWLIVAIEGSLNVVAPIVGPMIVDAILGPVDEMFVAIVPLICAREIIRRLFDAPKKEK